MSFSFYEDLKSKFIKVINDDFMELIQKNSKKTASIIKKPNFKINIIYPVYKSKIDGSNITYDYRVEINGVPISHVNIILDLYNKSFQIDNDK